MEEAFQALGVQPEVVRALRDVGYEEPTPVQCQAIPALVDGRDLIAQSQTGTGKTAAFAIPMIQEVDTKEKVVQGLVLCPTRELAIQVAETVHKLGKYRGVSDIPIYGGQPIDRQLRSLRQGVQIVVGTPGRIMDHMRRGTLDLSNVKLVVLDEADLMLDMGFADDIEVILDDVPDSRELAIFSATLPPRIRHLADRYMKN
ncbi:MAG: DEAD/DEAH box helicase, partial [Chloroflexota bacterium]